MAPWEILLVLGGVALVLLFVYFLYSAAFRAFEAVGFTRGQATLLLVGTFLLSAIDIPLWVTDNGWILAINLGGAGVPLILALWLLSRRPSAIPEALASVAVVTLVAFLVVTVTPEGIVAPLYLAILPPVTAAAMSLLAHWREESYAAPLAFIGGALGSLIGADLLHIGEFLAQTPPADGPAVASMGGAGVWDMVFLSAILAVALDVVFFQRIRKERALTPNWAEAQVFTTGTPPEIIRDWKAPSNRPSRTENASERLRKAVEERQAALAAQRAQRP